MSAKKKTPLKGTQPAPADPAAAHGLSFAQPGMRILGFEALLFCFVTLMLANFALLAASPWGRFLPFLAAALLYLLARRMFPEDSDRAHEFCLANGLAVLLVLRPWLDGMTFPQHNYFFVWGTVGLTLAWGGRVLYKGSPLQWPGLSLLALAFPFVALLVAPATIQMDATYRSLVLYGSYALLFVVAANGLQSLQGIGIVLIASLSVWLAQSAFSLVHLYYLLPQTRELLMQDQSGQLLQMHTGMEQMSAQFAHRLLSNRAFGSFLFPNALAAYMLPAISVALGAVGYQFYRMRAALKTPEPISPPHDLERRKGEIDMPLAVAIMAWLLSGALFFALYSLYRAQAAVMPMPVSSQLVRWAFIVGAAPLGVGAGTYGIVRAHGLRTYGYTVQLVLAGFTVPMAAITLVLTFSRGGMLSMVVALVATAVLFVRTGSGGSHLLRGGAILALVGLCGLLTLGAAVPGAEEGPSAASATLPNDLDITGSWLTFGDLLRPDTFGLRVGYWQVGVRMAQDNWLTGVGLGNFGTAYPNYQFVGAGDVKQTHNDYLQTLCETGLGGLFAFVIFWGAVLRYGLRGFRWTTDPARRWLFAGLFCGVLAFLLHAVVDFNFVNPSLAMTQYALAGLLLSSIQAPGSTPQGTPSLLRPRLMAGLMVAVALTVAVGAVRVRGADNALADTMTQSLRYGTADYLLEVSKPQAVVGERPNPIPYQYLRAFLPNRDALEEFGTFYLSRGAGAEVYRPMGRDEPLRPEAVFLVTDRRKAYESTRAAIRGWLNHGTARDNRYPYSPELAVQQYRWYELMLNHAPRAEWKSHLEGMLEWTRKATERSPRQALYQTLLAEVLWQLAGVEGSTERYRESLEHYRKATELYPTSHETWKEFGERLFMFAEALEGIGESEEAEHIRDEGEAAQERALLFKPRRPV